MKAEKKEAQRAIQQGARGTLDALNEWLEWELEEARQVLEMARDEPQIYRAQGRCEEIRNLLGLIKRG